MTHSNDFIKTAEANFGAALSDFLNEWTRAPGNIAKLAQKPAAPAPQPQPAPAPPPPKPYQGSWNANPPAPGIAPPPVAPAPAPAPGGAPKPPAKAAPAPAPAPAPAAPFGAAPAPAPVNPAPGVAAGAAAAELTPYERMFGKGHKPEMPVAQPAAPAVPSGRPDFSQVKIDQSRGTPVRTGTRAGLTDQEKIDRANQQRQGTSMGRPLPQSTGPTPFGGSKP